MRTRFYDPYSGILLQRDPFGYINSSCLYAYLGQNPISLTDPLGKWVWILVGAGVGGVTTYLTNPKATLSDVIEGAQVGAVVGGVTTATFGAASS